MTTLVSHIHYPSGDGSPVAETYVHLYAILVTLEVLKQYLEGQQAAVLANQFLYYSQGIPTARVAPDVMIIFGVEPGGRDNYKVWEEGQVPAVVFEMTSATTQNKDKSFKKNLYAQLGVQEYWLFDPKGEWIPEQLEGYRSLTVEVDDELTPVFLPITDGCSQALGLRLQVEGALIGFYRLDTGEKLLIPTELAAGLRTTAARLEEEQLARQLAEQRAEKAEQLASALAERLRSMGVDPDNL
ncbi:MAG: Uma2 family endonuclease [Aphanocapsa lilacina HA4352-LM1]|jgi:Uma2 family endonuclease|nr:Uma2 family endonuclease [Aphanocapsa lilacina HA4352-LM1]